MSRTVLLVPRRADGSVRDRLWAFCQAQWRKDHPDFDIFEGHHEATEGPFNRSAAINRAAKAAGEFDTAVIIDSDVLIDAAQVRAGLALAQNFDRVIIPFREYHSLTQHGTSRILSGWKGDYRTVSTARHLDSVSCVVMVPRVLWDTVGGFDERFIDWGWEDRAFAWATDAIAGHLRLNGALWHLWHPIAPGRNHLAAQYKVNTGLAAQYRHAASTDWDAMMRVLAQPGGPLG